MPPTDPTRSPGGEDREPGAAAPDPGHTTGPFAPAAMAAGGVVGGRYKLLEQIGEGGMGAVWMADQTHPVRRRVAVKLVRPDRAEAKAFLARFEAERQAIALMDHPHVARLLDAGATEAGDPFFVMELVKGVPLTEFCDAHRLTVPARLALFVRICSAVQHAHQKGVIHRDLKPSNVLVESHDGRPVPKVIDFGLAKAATGLPLTDRTLFTGFGTVLGTPQYMAPEQATFNALDVDTRADVYALGVLLYELLTGTTPLPRETIRGAAFEEVLRLIREQEVPRPSTRLSAPDARPAVAAARGAEPAQLGRLVRGDLDWIVLKALAKERDRRYDTAAALGRDVERFLAHEPVSAGPPSAAYRLRKFVRRNRPQVAAAAVALAALLAGVAGTALALVEARRARDAEAATAVAERAARRDAESERQKALAGEQLARDRLTLLEAERAKAEAGEKLARERLALIEVERKKAEAERQTAVAVLDFLQNKLLAQADVAEQANALLRGGDAPGAARWNPRVEELLDRAAAELAPDRIEKSLPGRPHVQAELLHTVGKTYSQLGYPAKAVPLLTRADDLYRRHAGEEGEDTLANLHTLAHALERGGKVAEAVALYEKLCAVWLRIRGADHKETLLCRFSLAGAYCQGARRKEGVALLEQVHGDARRALGADDLSTLRMGVALAGQYATLDREAEARSLHEEARDRFVRVLGEDHPETLVLLANLASFYTQVGDRPAAEALYRRTCRRLDEAFGPDHPNTLIVLGNFGSFYMKWYQWEQALPLLERSAAGMDRLGPLQPRYQPLVVNLIRTCEALREYQKAEVWLRKWLDVVEREYGTRHAFYGSWLRVLGENLLRQGRWADAEEVLRRGLAVSEREEPKSPQTWYARGLLGAACLRQKKFAEAEPHLLAAYDRHRIKQTPNISNESRRRVRELIPLLADLYAATDRPGEAKKILAEWPRYHEQAPRPRPAG